MRVTMNIDAFWEAIFSEDDAHVRAAFGTLDAEERASVFDLLRRIDGDDARVAAQREAARVAMRRKSAKLETATICYDRSSHMRYHAAWDTMPGAPRGHDHACKRHVEHADCSLCDSVMGSGLVAEA